MGVKATAEVILPKCFGDKSACQDIPDRWDDDIPSTVASESERCDDADVSAAMIHPLPSSNGRQGHRFHDSLQDDSIRACVTASECGLSTGRRSRFRKDLVNLNKAVVKWLARERKA